MNLEGDEESESEVNGKEEQEKRDESAANENGEGVEIEAETKSCPASAVQESGDSPANPSVDSSTDTLIPVNEPIVNGGVPSRYVVYLLELKESNYLNAFLL